MNNKNIEKVFSLMRELGVSLNDLCDFKVNYPFEVRYSDGTISYNIAHGKERRPIGILIGKTTFSFPVRLARVRKGRENSFLQNSAFTANMPSAKMATRMQLMLLSRNLDSYNALLKRLGQAKLPEHAVIDCREGLAFNMADKTTTESGNYISVLGVID